MRPLVVDSETGRTRREGSMQIERERDLTKVREARVRQRAIGIVLRNTYRSITEEPVPTEFLDLLRKIDEAEDQRRQP